MSDNQLHILQHALGLDEYGRGSMYRNHYVTDAEGDPDCETLRKAGLMKGWGAREIFGGGRMYSVTDKGKDAVIELSPPAPKLTRSQKRYQRWLNADCGMSFGEWLKLGIGTRRCSS